MQHNKITNMRYTFMYLFICYFTNIIPSIEYAQIKENQIISKAFFINACTYLFYYFYLIQILGLYTSHRHLFLSCVPCSPSLQWAPPVIVDSTFTHRLSLAHGPRLSDPGAPPPPPRGPAGGAPPPGPTRPRPPPP